MKSRGFSLVELLLVVAVVAGISLVSWSFIRRRQVSNEAVCQTNLRVLSLGLEQYAQDYDGRFPRVALDNHPLSMSMIFSYGWGDALVPYVPAPKFFYCPNVNCKRPSSIPTAVVRGFTDYWFNRNLSGANLDFIASKKSPLPHPANTIVLGDGNDGTDNSNARYSEAQLPAAWLNDSSSPAYRHDNGLNLLFADGHVKWAKPQDIMASPRNGPSFALK